MNTQLKIMNLFSKERERQEQLKKAGRFAHTLADPEMSHQGRLACLGEEFGEVAGAVVQCTGLSNDRQDGRDDLKKELIQLGACVVAWLEALE